MIRSFFRNIPALVCMTLGLAATAPAQSTHADVPFVKSGVTIDGVLSPGEWTGALAIAVEGTTPQTNPGWNPLNGAAIDPADLSYTVYLMHDGVYFHIAFDVTDNSVSDDYTATRPDETEVWNDDCTEVFIDGDRDRDVTESSGGSPTGDRDWREGMQPHFGVRANSHWQAGSGTKDKTWWAATTRTAKGYVTEYRFAFRGIDTADGEATFEPLKTGDTVGFSVLVNDDDNGGNREHQLAWVGGGTDDSLYRTQANWGTATLLAPPGYTEPGIATRVENTTLLIDSVPGANPGTFVSERVFSQLAFESPMLLIESPDTSGRLFVIEQRGRIRSFVKATNPSPGSVTTYLDIASRVRSPLEGGGGLEEGLLGLAFDPDFASNGRLYVYYTARSDPRRQVVSRFTATPPTAATVNASTEEILLEIPHPEANHNAGMMEFGPDGMLYISVGDGGGAGDNAGLGNNAQNTTRLLGKMLRIDVRSAPDAGLAYRIPPDNPFFAGGPAGTATRKEIYAYGLRNPWRWSFDRQSGALLCGDVGQDQYEEINVIQAGGNYGWRVMEGPACFNAASCDSSGMIPPIATYQHDEGLAVTGGYVYYGADVPALYGKYIYGDYASARVWSLTYNAETGATTAPVQIADLSGFALASFGQDKTGEVYLININDGTIHVLRPGSTPPAGAAVTTSPAPPVQGQPVTILYNATGRVLAGSATVNIYRGYNAWTNIASSAMTSLGNNLYSFTYTVPASATVLDMVFNNGSGTWDNNEGSDWHIATTSSGGSTAETVTTIPAPPVRGQAVTVIYNSTGRSLQSAATVVVHRGYNGWTTPTDNTMTALGNRLFSYTFVVPAAATVLDFAFNNGSGTWDNNNSADWHISTTAAARGVVVDATSGAPVDPRATAAPGESLARALAAACDGTRPFPTRLSEIPALLNAGLGLDQSNAGIIPYEPSAKLWSDNARKERFIALPGLDTIGYSATNGWDFGEDAVIIKNFLLPLDERTPDATLKRIETRLLIKNCGEWVGFSYEWNEAETDATLLTSSKKRSFSMVDRYGALLNYEWQYPSQTQCTLCHTSAANGVLGLQTAQLNSNLRYPHSGITANQLATLNHLGFFGDAGLPAEPGALPAMPDPFDGTKPLRDRARAYLAANCAQCHQPGGGGGGTWDLRWHIADEATGILDRPAANSMGVPNARIVAPGDADRSVLYLRMMSTSSINRMPPLATSRIDEDGTALIREWIESLGTDVNGSSVWYVR